MSWEFLSGEVNWNPLRDLDLSLSSYGAKRPNDEDVWKYPTFAAGAGPSHS
jgi:hypothetical protein